VSPRSESQLTDEERKRLAEARQRVKRAEQAYAPFVQTSPLTDKPTPVVQMGAMTKAQDELDAAKRELAAVEREVLDP
jgi:uncharacterized damage-inducible protein DinB